MVNVLIAYYSAFGHVFEMAQAVRDGADSLDNVETRLRKFPEIEQAKENMEGNEMYEESRKEQKDVDVIELDDLRWADGVCWGTPTRFGNMASQVKQFIDNTGGLWIEGALEDKPAGIFTSSATIHGGQESTILSFMIPLMHHGMVIVGLPYGDNPQLRTTEGVGGSPYGPSTIADSDGSRWPVEEELTGARNLGKRVAEVANQLKDL